MIRLIQHPLFLAANNDNDTVGKKMIVKAVNDGMGKTEKNICLYFSKQGVFHATV